MFGYLFLVASGVAVASGQFLNCNWVNKLDCVTYAAGVICASNGQDYSNRCYLAKAQCADSTLRTVSEGTCASSGITKPPSNAPIVTSGAVVTAGATKPAGPTTTREPVFVNHNQLLDFFCLELMHETCPTDTEKVCGTDGVTYANFCEYEKQRCGHRDLQVKNFGDC
ncbi:tomoregulin-2-like [Mercenaria mercenaria]|uniref:tomoregulin-2-like n=1 Tax=Mercenaria mercenaria TaxID=6596 RepID=UPI001E1D9F14|nr:tomoregulin-2-like [Mercenaria mercenaria]